MDQSTSLVTCASPTPISQQGNRAFPKTQFRDLPSAGSLNSAQQFNFVALPASGTIPTTTPLLGKDTFSLDPALNSYILFAGGGIVTSSNGAIGLRTDFNFFNGGSPVNNTSIYWGNFTSSARLPVPSWFSPSAQLGQVSLYDTASNAEFNLTLPSSANGGVITWSAYSDRVEITTYAYCKANQTYTAAAGIGHGILSQPLTGL